MHSRFLHWIKSRKVTHHCCISTLYKGLLASCRGCFFVSQFCRVCISLNLHVHDHLITEVWSQALSFWLIKKLFTLYYSSSRGKSYAIDYQNAKLSRKTSFAKESTVLFWCKFIFRRRRRHSHIEQINVHIFPRTYILHKIDQQREGLERHRVVASLFK